MLNNGVTKKIIIQNETKNGLIKTLYYLGRVDK